jgi:iron complex outermembrane receptor protein
MRRLIASALLALVGTASVHAQDTPSDLKKLSLQQLLDVDVTSVSRRQDTLARTAAAVTVLTGEDIRRLGVTSIPEALRIVPGVQVARASAGGWAITARGFTSAASNKLLVLIDGRPVYSPIFSGVFWDIQDLVLEDIERIEVVRGPGATLWGANAVNGVINIITKSAHDTRGTVVSTAGAGATDLVTTAVQVGGGPTADVSYRAFGKYFYRDESKLADGEDGNDAARLLRTGFRADVTRAKSEYTVMGDLYSGLTGIRGRSDSKTLGGYAMARWSRTFSKDSSLQVQTYFERNYRRVPLQSDFNQLTLNIDVQHQFVTGRHHAVWGAEYRWNKDTTRPTPVLFFVPAERTYPLATAFIQDEISFASDAVRVLIGSKFEHNDYTGFEFQPSIRANFLVRPNTNVWVGVARAVRTPTRFDTDIRFSPPGLTFTGDPDFASEKLIAYEAGYRARVTSRLATDVAVFFNDYDDVRSLELSTPPRVDLLNNLNAHTYGGEVSLTYDVLKRTRVTTGYSYLQKHLSMDAGHRDLFNGTLEGNDPKHQLFVRQTTNLPGRVEVDSTLRFVDNLPTPFVPHYVELDMRAGWTWKTLELSMVGQNLLDAQHPEFNAASPLRAEVLRNVYARVAFRP